MISRVIVSRVTVPRFAVSHVILSFRLFPCRCLSCRCPPCCCLSVSQLSRTGRTLNPIGPSTAISWFPPLRPPSSGLFVLFYHRQPGLSRCPKLLHYISCYFYCSSPHTFMSAIKLYYKTHFNGLKFRKNNWNALDFVYYV